MEEKKETSQTAGTVSEEMFVYYEGSMAYPENIINSAKSMFTKVILENKQENQVRVLVPKAEQEIIKNFKTDVVGLLLEIQEDNSVLAKNLARRHGF